MRYLIPYLPMYVYILSLKMIEKRIFKQTKGRLSFGPFGFLRDAIERILEWYWPDVMQVNSVKPGGLGRLHRYETE